MTFHEYLQTFYFPALPWHFLSLQPAFRVASLSQLRPRSAPLWAAFTEHFSPPSTPVAASPCLADTRRPLGATQFRSEPSYRRSAAAAALASLWNSLFRPLLTQFDPGLSSTTSPGSFPTAPPSSKGTGVLPPPIHLAAGRRPPSRHHSEPSPLDSKLAQVRKGP
jgi:hypothetical protein